MTGSKLSVLALATIAGLWFGHPLFAASMPADSVAGKVFAESARVIDPAQLLGKPAGSALETYLDHGYQCGLYIDEWYKTHTTRRPRLWCTKAAPERSRCRLFAIVMDVDWSSPSNELPELYRRIGDSSVTAVDGVCSTLDTDEPQPVSASVLAKIDQLTADVPSQSSVPQDWMAAPLGLGFGCKIASRDNGAEVDLTCSGVLRSVPECPHVELHLKIEKAPHGGYRLAARDSRCMSRSFW